MLYACGSAFPCVHLRSPAFTCIPRPRRMAGAPASVFSCGQDAEPEVPEMEVLP